MSIIDLHSFEPVEPQPRRCEHGPTPMVRAFVAWREKECGARWDHGYEFERWPLEDKDRYIAFGEGYLRGMDRMSLITRGANP